MEDNPRLWFVQLRRPLGDDSRIARMLKRGERVCAQSTLEVIELLDDGRVVLQRAGDRSPRMGCARLTPSQLEQVTRSISQGRLPVVHFSLEVVKRLADGSYLALTDSPCGCLLETDPPALPALSELLGLSQA